MCDLIIIWKIRFTSIKNRMKYTDHPWGFMLIHKVPWFLKNYTNLPWGLHLIKMPRRLRNYTDYPWDFGLIHKAPLGWSVYFRGALCINSKSQGWSVYYRKNLLQVLNFRGGYCNFSNIRSTLCIKGKPQGRSLYFTL